MFKIMFVQFSCSVFFFLFWYVSFAADILLTVRLTFTYFYQSTLMMLCIIRINTKVCIHSLHWHSFCHHLLKIVIGVIFRSHVNLYISEFWKQKKRWLVCWKLDLLKKNYLDKLSSRYARKRGTLRMIPCLKNWRDLIRVTITWRQKIIMT